MLSYIWLWYMYMIVMNLYSDIFSNQSHDISTSRIGNGIKSEFWNQNHIQGRMWTQAKLLLLFLFGFVVKIVQNIWFCCYMLGFIFGLCCHVYKRFCNLYFYCFMQGFYFFCHVSVFVLMLCCLFYFILFMLVILFPNYVFGVCFFFFFFWFSCV